MRTRITVRSNYALIFDHPSHIKSEKNRQRNKERKKKNPKTKEKKVEESNLWKKKKKIHSPARRKATFLFFFRPKNNQIAQFDVGFG